MARVCIITPFYRGERFLAATLAGVRAQTFSDWEHVIVDDGSPEASSQALRACAHGAPRTRIIRQENGGVASARNRGYAEAAADADCLIFLDQDDVWEPDALRRLVAVLDAHPEFVAAHGLPRDVDEHGQPLADNRIEQWGRDRRDVRGGRLVRLSAQQPTSLSTLAFCNCIYTPGQILIRRAAFEQVGPFDEKAPPSDDWDMWLRLSSRGDIGFLDDVVIHWRRHESNGSHHRKQMRRGELYVRRKLLRSRDLDAGQHRVARHGDRLWHLSSGADCWDWARTFAARRQIVAAAKMLRHCLWCYTRAATGLA